MILKTNQRKHASKDRSNFDNPSTCFCVFLWLRYTAACIRIKKNVLVRRQRFEKIYRAAFDAGDL